MQKTCSEISEQVFFVIQRIDAACDKNQIDLNSVDRFERPPLTKPL
jgi:hypothetical protein